MNRHATAFFVMVAGIGGLIWCGHDVARASQFSAELVTGKADGDAMTPAGKVYVDELKVRIETPEFPDSFLLIDGSVPAAYLVRTLARVFMDAKQSSRLSRLFVPLTGDDPCPQWQVLAEVAGIPDQAGHWRCTAAGHDNVAGRNTVKFDATSPRGHSVGWIDPELKFPLKIEIEDGSVFLLQNLQDGPQSADLFVVPAGYKKFEPRLLIEWLKHSDVLVEPMH
jgi:hypothetical protein